MSDEELVSACLNNVREAQEAFYRKFADKMFSVCKYYAEDRDEACDFLQEGFITVFRKLDRYNFEGSLEGWIRRIVVNTALQEIRKKKVFQEHYNLIKIEQEELYKEDVSTSELNPKDIIQWVNELPKKAGLIMKLYAIEGYTHPEIAEILDVSVGTSKSQLNRARALLKAKMNAQG
ncbi:MAG: sigma-70 family RNA polymerase sigma factor [bacterium]|nr:sigma-70 family RNA polymerase sigma factor [bacterium]